MLIFTLNIYIYIKAKYKVINKYDNVVYKENHFTL